MSHPVTANVPFICARLNCMTGDDVEARTYDNYERVDYEDPVADVVLHDADETFHLSRRQVKLMHSLIKSAYGAGEDKAKRQVKRALRLEIFDEVESYQSNDAPFG